MKRLLSIIDATI
ncbi:Protein of unknown function [Bacillus mycoides]|nr:Protein of unknown function [Bacillus mycoides]